MHRIDWRRGRCSSMNRVRRSRIIIVGMKKITILRPLGRPRRAKLLRGLSKFD